MRQSLIDTWLVARFEVLRAVRTWRALALIIIYLIANLGGAYLFIEALTMMEGRLADQMGVAKTDRPGAMTSELLESDGLREMLEFLVHDPGVIDQLITYPLLAIFQLYLGLLFIPFLSATTAAEAVAIDVQSGAIRFEALRTGRPELVAGRLLGQALLSVTATTVALVGVWCMGMTLMVRQDPLLLAWGLASLGMRAVVYAIPFAGVGIAASQWTTSPAWARVMALSLTAISGVVYLVMKSLEEPPWSTLADAVLTVLPQSYLGIIWHPTEWLFSAVVYVALGLVAMGLGYLRFSDRDL